MSGAKRSERWTVARFLEVASAQRESGLSVQGYCRQQGIALSRFYRWRGVAQGVSGDHGASTRVTSRQKQNSFIDLNSMSTFSAGLTLRFELGGGLSLTITR